MLPRKWYLYNTDDTVIRLTSMELENLFNTRRTRATVSKFTRIVNVLERNLKVSKPKNCFGCLCEEKIALKSFEILLYGYYI